MRQKLSSMSPRHVRVLGSLFLALGVRGADDRCASRRSRGETIELTSMAFYSRTGRSSHRKSISAQLASAAREEGCL